MAVTVIPRENARYARDRGWIGPSDPFDLEAIVTTLHEQVTDLYPSADYRHEVVDRFAPHGTIPRRLKSMAFENDATMVFIGSHNAGRVVSSFASVGASVASEDAYDVVIVRQRSTDSDVSRTSASDPPAKSSFYVPE
ncbi:MAG: universal stress protein [Halanaeroarchaeum sp.]